MTAAPGGGVRAAGGVVWREAGPRGPEIVVVNRPRYDDWTLPKGKLEPGEPALLAAVREVFEETGIEAVPQVRLPTITYLTGAPGVEKSVDFWSMRVRADHGHPPDHEVAQVRWVPVGRAPALLTYAHDRGVVAAFGELAPITAEVLLVRHARAGSRQTWQGPDELRPLDPVGRRQAEALSRLLAAFPVARVVSATPSRCQATVAGLGLPVRLDPAFDETSPAGAEGALAAVRELATAAPTSVVCSQGGIIPRTLTMLRPANGTAVESYQTPKGGGWLLAFAGDRAVAADRLAPEPVLD